ncbi:MAG: hypothetical protein JWQ29_1540 [Phenylobacterium sp.]|nr:hypothetical protein [Phenylobacterium sp.]
MNRPALTPSLAIWAALLALAASAARAGEAACWFENGVVVVPAQVMGVAGDFILDTATPHTQLAETQAQAAGFAGTALTGEVRLAGLTLAARPVAVADLDMRTGALPTPIAGVIGADVLKAYVLDVGFAPCRIALSAPGRGPRFRSQAVLPMTWVADRPVVEATASDGVRTLTANFTPGTGADRAVRLSDAAARAPGAARLGELYPYGILKPRLHSLAFAGAVSEDLAAGLMGAEDPALAGQLGAPFLARYRLRFDFPAGRLLLAPAGP